MHSNVDVDEERYLRPSLLSLVRDRVYIRLVVNRYRDSVPLRELDQLHELLPPNDFIRDEHILESSSCKDLGLAHLLNADSLGTSFELHPRDRWNLVGFDVGPKLYAALFGEPRHLLDVPPHSVYVNKKSWRIDLEECLGIQPEYASKFLRSSGFRGGILMRTFTTSLTSFPTFSSSISTLSSSCSVKSSGGTMPVPVRQTLRGGTLLQRRRWERNSSSDLFILEVLVDA